MTDEVTSDGGASPLPRWGKTGRPPKAAAGTYTPLADIPKEPGPGRGGQVPTANRGGKNQPIIAPDARAAARAIYEATPGATCALVFDQLGGRVPESTLRRWKSEDGWKSVARTVSDLPARAAALANTFKVRMSELGKPLSDEVAAQEVSRDVSVQHAVDIRAGILDRHRKEWSAPRKLAYDAIQLSNKGDQTGAFERAKLAKITAETLQIVQVGECRAFGLNEAARGADGGTVVVIDRQSGAATEVQTGGPDVVAAAHAGADSMPPTAEGEVF